MKHNQIILCGILNASPKILKDEERSFAQFRVVTINGNRTGGRRIESKAFDCPLIHTSDPGLIEQIEKTDIGDLVIIKGAVTTAIVKRRPKCEHCGQRNEFPGILAYISPASITVIEKKCALNEDGSFSKDKAVSKLKNFKEVSNVLTVMGVVCREPQPYKTEIRNKSRMTAYQLAIKRKLRIIGEIDDNTADFPWVKSYGKISINDGLYIRKGTYMFIDGWFRARKFERKATCQHCGEEVKWTDFSHDIVPYASEYIKNYNLPEDITEKEYAEYNAKRIHIDTEDSINEDEIMAQEDKDNAEKLLDEINESFKAGTDEEQTEKKTENNEIINISSLKKQ